MRDKAKQISGAPRAALAKAALATTALCLALLALASSAQAAYQQLPEPDGVFGGSTTPIEEGKEFPEEVQLGGTAAMAVNRSGAGEVPAGTVYAVHQGLKVDQSTRVAMFEPKAGGGLEFAESWTVSGSEAYERCGPLLGVDGEGKAEHPCAPQVDGGAESNVGIDVDQSTGYVYVYDRGLARNEPSGPVVAGNKVIVTYKADGSEVVGRFGEQAAGGQTVAESPTKVHGAFSSDVLAVNGAGEAFVYDEVRLGESYQRLMVFRPHEGDYADYEYVGEVAAASHAPKAPAFDEAGNLYVAGLGGSGGHVEALPHETPGAYPNPAQAPRCEYKVKGASLMAMSVDPATGEPFYSSEKRPNRIGHLGPCDESTHEFAEAAEPEEIALEPAPEFVYGLAFDPARETGEARPDGALYAASPGPTESQYAEGGYSALGYAFGRPEEQAPKVTAESVSAVTSSGALAHATIDPVGFATHYTFQYMTEAEYEAAGESFEGASEAPSGGAGIGASGGVQSVSVALGPLTPDTEYRFRVVLSSECEGKEAPPCEGAGEAKALHTYPTGITPLPDGRAWELVSPAQKYGGEVLPAAPNVFSSFVCTGCKPGYFANRFPMQSAPGGNAVAYEGTAFGAGGAKLGNEYVARRDPSTGWETAKPMPALLLGGYQGFTSQLTQAVLAQPGGYPTLAPGAPTGYANLYAQPTASPFALTPLLAGGLSFHRGAEEFNVSYADASADGSRVFFAANDALSGETPYAPAAEDGGAAKFNLYESHEGRLALVNVMPGNAETHPGASFATASANTVSADGRRAYFSDESGQVYVREDARRTREIPDGGKFLSASKDGSKVLLGDGFLYDLETNTGVDLSEGKGGFEGALGQSEDLSHLYFVDGEVLDETPNEAGEEAEAGKNNLYAWQQGGHAHFVARLADEDNAANGTGKVSDWLANPAHRTAEASPDGRYLAFLTQRPLDAGYDNNGPCTYVPVTETEPTHYVDGPCPEAYLYDSVTARLVCASCNPSGSAPLGWSVLRRINDGGAFPQPRYLTDTGRLFFDSEDSLSPLDTNEGAEDVYEWEPGGVGSCTQAGGCVALISAGREREDSNFVAINEGGEGAPGGADVFFTTRDRLVAKDTDELFDLYDAREGGGEPGESETQRSECQGESCQPSPNPPSEVTPASAAFAGAGNLAQGNPSKPRCPKGRKQVKRKGKTRCVAKHAKRHHRKHRRHHKRAHRRANGNRRTHR